MIGEAGESCAFYIARKLGMPAAMLSDAARAAYGFHEASDRGEMAEKADFLNSELQADEAQWRKEKTPHIRKQKSVHTDAGLSRKFSRGDSVMIYPDKKIGIVCEPVNEKGVLRVQLQDKKIYINHKRVRLHVAAEKLYPADYDFSIIFDSVETRKTRHQMERKYVDALLNLSEE